MKKVTNKSGFSLGELLAAVAILIILMGIGFVAVTAYIRNLRLNEMDWTAKELFIASQNQLSKAYADGSLSRYLSSHDGEDTYYVLYSNGKADDKNEWEMILPFGAIDDTVRLSGSYIIEYDPKAVSIKQVYYSDNYEFVDSDLGVDVSSRETRKRYKGNNIIGWYQGDTDSLEFRTLSDKPILKVTNGDRLVAKIEGTSANTRVLLCIKGVTSGAEKTVRITDFVNEYVLDDVTGNNTNHFKLKIVSDSSVAFIPGEDIELFATVSAVNDKDELVLSNVPESNHVITNSLFASSSEKNVGENVETTVQISSFRHLLNLDPEISGIPIGTDVESEVNVKTAEQISDLVWSDATEAFSQKTGGNVFTLDGKSHSGTGNYYPITMTYDLIYEGKDRYIDRVVVNTADRNGGLFGNVVDGKSLSVNDLELRNFNISVTGSGFNAGALVGTSSGALSIDNVIAYNTLEDDSALGIESGEDSGGLVGAVLNTNRAETNITYSAAAVYVKGAATAGGMVGNLSAGTVSDSYVGGHTSGGVFIVPSADNALSAGRPNVWATGTNGVAGGLIGSSGTITVENCYSAASAYGADNNSDIFVGGKPDLKNTGKNYAAGWMFEPKPVGNEMRPVFPEIYMIDIETNTMKETQYNYDSFWDNDYYPYKTIQELDGGLSEATAAWFLKDHVGDWALPGELIDLPNTKN